MGQSGHKGLDEDIVQAQISTHFTLADLKNLKSIFLMQSKIVPETGKRVVDKENFKETLKDVHNIGTQNEELLDHIFEVFDRDHNGLVDYKEFVIGLSRFCMGSLSERTKFIFEAFDLDGNGKITKDEMQKIMESLSKVQKEASLTNVPQLVNDFFAKYDINGDGILDLKEFTKLVSNHPEIMDLVSNFGPYSEVKGFVKRGFCYVVSVDIHSPLIKSLDMILRLVKPEDHIVLCHIFAPLDIDLKPPMMPQEEFKKQHFIKKEQEKEILQKDLETIKARHNKAPECSIISREGDPFKSLVGLCEELKADVLVMTSHGSSPFAPINDHLSVGDEVTSIINKVACSVLIVK